MANITIRKYTDNDEHTIVNMTCDKYAEELAGYARINITVAEYDGIVAGYSYVNIRTSSAEQSFVFIYVSEKYRCHGIGTTLYMEAESRCKEAGNDGLFTSYIDEDDTDIFLRKLNFSINTSTDYMKYAGGIISENIKMKTICVSQKFGFVVCTSCIRGLVCLLTK